MLRRVRICKAGEMDREIALLKKGPGTGHDAYGEPNKSDRLELVEAKSLPEGYGYSIWRHRDSERATVAYTMLVATSESD
jgi:hypothetical protein